MRREWLPAFYDTVVLVQVEADQAPVALITGFAAGVLDFAAPVVPNGCSEGILRVNVGRYQVSIGAHSASCMIEERKVSR